MFLNRSLGEELAVKDTFLIFQCLLNISEVPQFPHFVTLIVIRYHTDNQHLITLMTPETWTKMMYSSFPNKLVG